MAPDLGDYWWVPIAAAAISGLLFPIYGYFKPPRDGPSQSRMHGSMMIDSSVARDALRQLAEQVIQTRRLADAAEGLLEVEQSRDKRKAAERHVSEIETLRREIEKLKSDKR